MAGQVTLCTQVQKHIYYTCDITDELGDLVIIHEVNAQLSAHIRHSHGKPVLPAYHSVVLDTRIPRTDEG